MNFVEILGYVSAACLSVCGLPLAYEAIRTRRAKVNGGFFWLWYVGEITGLIYCLSIGSIPLILNYLFNVVFLTIVCYYLVRMKYEG